MSVSDLVPKRAPEEPWHKWLDAWPDWHDSGRGIEARYANGRCVAGVLRCDDVGFDGEDEYPIWVVETYDGAKASFAENTEWRFLSPRRRL